ncbi:substrate-binding domain-containing protein [Bifidobacterium sp. 82T10]|uniref:Substrate-binding domain-containing protein n=1 Tax=Bifidobacterium miconis TaxID=2834435 RepID=A0ABS6WGN4_9BIFI|nr:substrate-binding domain-containing protein [Bifidobacterium miconis]MBW3092905.1 substrate-binding domain-containing protein [Bifidobacterium miconis]
MATIKEIAQQSGFSATTVSRLLNGDPTFTVKKETREKILQVSERLGYTVPSRIFGNASQLAVLDALAGEEELQNAYYRELRNTLLATSQQQNLSLTFYTDIPHLIENADEYGGFIAIGPGMHRYADLKALHEVLPNGVFIDTNPAPNLFDSVQPDLAQTVLDALDAAMAAGMRRIGFIGSVGRTMGVHEYPEDLRFMAYKNWTERLGLESGPTYVDGPVSVENGLALGRRVVADLGRDGLPDCFITATDVIAVGVLQAFVEAGIVVPRDVSIISINDQTIARYTSPPLTTFAIDQRALVGNAIAMLLESIDAAVIADAHRHMLVSTKLVTRGSFIPASPSARNAPAAPAA